MQSKKNRNSNRAPRSNNKATLGGVSLRTLGLCGAALIGLGLWLGYRSDDPQDTPEDHQSRLTTEDSSTVTTETPPKLPLTSVQNPKSSEVNIKASDNASEGDNKPLATLPPVTQRPPEPKQDQLAERRKLPVETSKYLLEDGLAVIHGDMVVGVPVDSTDLTGYVKVPDLQLWIDTRIPFYISENVPDPQRIYDAFELFVNTPIKFVPWTDQEDAIVFEVGSRACKSYVGRIGGKQPIWLSGECSAKEVAHEIMHALGFVHEQNRMDRDQFINVLWDNIEEDFGFNFEILPKRLMKVSMAAPFDFQSLMIYSPYILSKNAKMTMTPINSRESIAPSYRLSDLDRFRLKKVYGDR